MYDNLRSMKRDKSQLNRGTAQRGSLLLEVVFAGALFSMVSLGVVSAVVGGRSSMASVEQRTQALYLAQEGIEALRSVRDSSPAALLAGEWGLSREGSAWTLEWSPDITEDVYMRTLTIAAPESGVWDVTSRVEWQTETGERSVELNSRLTDWR
jgi:hypothetical protein